jgi:K+-sensing histidine kinase KdpD
MVTQIMATLPGSRVACVNVLRTHLLRPDMALDDAGRNKHLQRLLELRHWAAPLKLPEERLTHHVLEATSAASALLEYAQLNRVDHIILGARADSLGRRVLGSVAAEIARNEKQLENLEKQIQGKESRLSNQAFVGKAPPEIIDKERQALSDLVAQRLGVEQALTKLRSL